MNCCLENILNYCVSQDCNFFYLKSDVSDLDKDVEYFLIVLFLGHEVKIKVICYDDKGSLKIDKNDLNNNYFYIGQLYTLTNELVMVDDYDAISFTFKPQIKNYV